MLDEQVILQEMQRLQRAYERQAKRAQIALEDVQLLVLAARGELSHEQFIEVRQLVQELLDLLFTTPVTSYQYSVPVQFWTQPGLGQLLARVLAWLDEDDWISYSQAAKLLYAHEDLKPDAALARIRRLVERGRLARYIDPNEPNEQHANRVSAQAVQKLLQQKEGEKSSGVS